MAKFEEYAVPIMTRLLADFPITVDDAGAILGNLGTETGGFTKLQEISPTVPGSKGGYGWPQWTGPRRRAYEAWCAKHERNKASFDANYAYMWLELSGKIKGYDYRSAITKTKAAGTLAEKVKAFELVYEGAGVKNYKSRENYARKAVAAFKASAALAKPKGASAVKSAARKVG